MKTRDRELAIVVSAALLIAMPFLGKGFQLDEPFFLDRARELVSGASWAPRAWSDYNNNPPMILWLLAAATRLAGESETGLRALFLPLDALAAGSLYLLFARFLKKPLAWALLAVLGPAYALNMGHLMAEKPAMAFGAAALYALVRGAEERRAGGLAASAALLSARGQPVWCAAKLGLRRYLLRAGAKPLDSQADWESARPGELVVFAKTTTNFSPARARRVNAERRVVASRVPLRLISGFGGEGGFYSDISGFLPFSPSAEPVEEFTVVEPL